MLYRKSSSKFLQKCFGYLQNISYICSLKSLGNNINLEIRYEYYITEEIGNERGD